MDRARARNVDRRLDLLATTAPDPEGPRMPAPRWASDPLTLDDAVRLHLVIDLPGPMRDELLLADHRPDLGMLRRLRRPEPLWGTETLPVAPETRPEPGRPGIDLQHDLRTDLYRQSWADELRRRFGDG